MITWVRDALPVGSKEQQREKHHLAGKEGWITRRWNARRRQKALRDASAHQWDWLGEPNPLLDLDQKGT